MSTSLFCIEFFVCIQYMQIGDILVHLGPFVYVTIPSILSIGKKPETQTKVQGLHQQLDRDYVASLVSPASLP